MAQFSTIANQMLVCSNILVSYMRLTAFDFRFMGFCLLFYDFFDGKEIKRIVRVFEKPAFCVANSQ